MRLWTQSSSPALLLASAQAGVLLIYDGQMAPVNEDHREKVPAGLYRGSEGLIPVFPDPSATRTTNLSRSIGSDGRILHSWGLPEHAGSGESLWFSFSLFD